MMGSINELGQDSEFRSRWPYIWSKLEPHLLSLQRRYAIENKGNYEKIGMFTEWMSELMDSMASIDIEIRQPEKIQRRKLHNMDLGAKIISHAQAQSRHTNGS